jgi:hypothetical protein
MIEYLVCWTAGGVALSIVRETVLEAETAANEVVAEGGEPRVERREFSNGRGRAPHIYTLFTANLDGLCRTDLATEAYYHRGTQYGDYATLKAGAMIERGEGRIQAALLLEQTCEQIYSRLPAWQRWLPMKYAYERWYGTPRSPGACIGRARTKHGTSGFYYDAARYSYVVRVRVTQAEYDALPQ